LIRVTPTVSIRGSVDCLGHKEFEGDQRVFENPTCVIEVKWFNKVNYRAWVKDSFDGLPALGTKYAYQLSAYMHGLSMDTGLMVVGNKETDEINLQLIHPAPISLSKLRAVVLQVEAYAKFDSFPPCTNQYPCPYYILHDGQSTIRAFSASPVIPVSADMTAELTTLAEQYIDASAKEAHYASEKKNARDSIATILSDANVDRVSTPLHTIGRHQSTRTRLDERLLMTALDTKDLSPYRTTTTQVISITVTREKKDAAHVPTQSVSRP
ncbi:MAG: hypothetical protein ACRDF4_12295, partial [Rhabdochlamydiaceae bacterium]